MKVALFTKVLAAPERDCHDVCEAAADLGYDAVEFMGRDHVGPDTTEAEARDLRATLDDCGLDVAALGTYTGGYVGVSDGQRRRELADLEALLDVAGVLGTDLLRHAPGGPSPHEADDADFEVAAEWLRRAADRDCRLAVEIHPNSLAETIDSTLRLLDAVDRENVGAIHDAGNMFIAGEPFGPASVERLGDRLFHVHVKDEARVERADLPGAFEMETVAGTGVFQHRRLGEGDVDHAPLFEALAATGYDGYLTDECHAPADDDAAVAAREREVLADLVAR